MSASDFLRFSVAMSLMPGIGPVTFKKLLESYGSLSAAFEAQPVDHREFLESADREILKASSKGARVISYFDDDYPEMLKNIYDPPIVLYVKGQWPPATALTIAVVGARQASGYGIRMAKKISNELASQGVVVVSGLALGIDASAHLGALEAGGKTIAVLGGGISKLYPKENGRLAEQIFECGAVISEYPMDMDPQAPFFPIRNRIISGLSSGVLVVEAREKSGALITVDSALEQNRDVFAMPGPADSKLSQGTHQLIRQGAKLTLGAADILEEYAMGSILPSRWASSSKAEILAGLSANQAKILGFLQHESVTPDDLIERSGLSAQQALSELAVLEIKGLVKKAPGNYLERAN